MNRSYWDNAAHNFEDEIFNVFDNDRLGLIRQAIGKYSDRNGASSDIGCGTGSFLPEMSRRAKHVTALDISPKVLERAKKHCAALTNVVYRVADLSKPGARLPKVDLCLCVNVILTPSLTHRTRMLDVICKHVRPNGHLILAVPSLESAMLTHSRRIEWNLKDGIAPSSASRASFPTMTVDEAHRLRSGVVDVDSVPHKHYLKEEICHLLSGRDMRTLRAEKIEYPWSSEFEAPPRWMLAPYPWDWMIIAQKGS